MKLSYLGTNILVYHILFKIGYNIRGCAKTYKLLMHFNNNIVKETQNKWEESLNEEIPYHIVEKSFIQIQRRLLHKIPTIQNITQKNSDE